MSHPQSALCLVSEAAEALGQNVQTINWFVSCNYLQKVGRRVTRQSITEFQSLWHREWPEDVKPKGYIYLMRYSYLYKIGLSKNVEQRMAGMTGALPSRVQIHLIHTIPTNNMRAAEKRLHTFFLARHVEKEWFHFRSKELDLIRQCKGILI